MTKIVPFWNIKSEYLSKNIWNPEDYKQDLINNSDLYFTETIHPFISSNKILSENTKPIEDIIISRKIRFYPTKKQKQYLHKCLSAHRYFYNKTIEEINRRYDKRKEEFSSSPTCVLCSKNKEENNNTSWTCSEHKKSTLPWKLSVNFNELRSIVVKNNNVLTKDEEWQADIPHDTRQTGVKNAVSAYTSAITNKIRGNIQNFKLNFLSKKKPSHIFWIDHRAISVKEKNSEVKVSIFKTKLKKESSLFIKKKYQKEIPLDNTSAVKVLYDRGSWYLVFSIKEQTQNKCNNLHSIALDPGVRTFQTGYSPNGSIYKFGEKQLNQMKKIHTRIDKLKSVASESQNHSNYKRRYHIKKRLAKLEFKLRGIIHNLHNQVGSFLSKNYRYILLPEFGTSKLQESDNIQSIIKRRMNGLAHYKFQLKMGHFCKKYGSELKIVDESYTSKTCGSCGNVKDDLGSACHYKCDNCSYSLDRDIHGARNIWVKTYSFN